MEIMLRLSVVNFKMYIIQLFNYRNIILMLIFLKYIYIDLNLKRIKKYVCTLYSYTRLL